MYVIVYYLSLVWLRLSSSFSVLCELYSASFVVHHIWLTYGPSHLASGSITDYYLCYLMDYSCSWRLDCLEFSVIIAFCCLVVVDTVIHRRCIIITVSKCCAFGCRSAYASHSSAGVRITLHSFPQDKDLRDKWIWVNPRKDFVP